MRICSRCYIEKSIEEFNKTGPKNYRRRICKTCYNELNRLSLLDPGTRERKNLKNRERYYANREVILATQRARIQANREVIQNLKNTPCSRCGCSFSSECMDFHHGKKDKEKGIGEIYGRSIKKILEEVKKCELVCSNCHRTIHKTSSM